MKEVRLASALVVMLSANAFGQTSSPIPAISVSSDSHDGVQSSIDQRILRRMS